MARTAKGPVCDCSGCIAKRNAALRHYYKSVGKPVPEGRIQPLPPKMVGMCPCETCEIHRRVNAASLRRKRHPKSDDELDRMASADLQRFR